MRPAPTSVLAILLCWGGLSAFAQNLTFEKDIRPILKAHCFHCHGEGEKLKGDVDLRLRRLMLKSTDEGPVLTPGKPESSRLLTLVKSGEMPKKEKKLADAEIAKLEKWIAQGAPTARPEPAEPPKGFVITEEERNFWSFLPVQKVTPPKVRQQASVRNPIDAFVLARLEKQRLSLAPEADRVTLIRRVYLDLLGLPPTPEEVDQFAADKAPDAYERLLDRVMESPRYGERWGRHWLDVAGYADSNGFSEADIPRSHAWHYRDYVIESFNADKPFNEFIVEQLAGDELEGVTVETALQKVSDTRARSRMVATGFLRMAPDGTEDGSVDQKLASNQAIADSLKVVTSSLLGLTVACAQCHDHRYDPISQEDYYKMRAIFEPAFDWQQWRKPGERLVSLYTAEQRTAAQSVEAEANKLNEAKDKHYKELLDKVFEKEILKVPEADREAVRVARNTAADKRNDAQKAILKTYPSANVVGQLDLYDKEAQKMIDEENKKIGEVRAKRPPETFLMVTTEKTGRIPEMPLFHRGDPDQPKQKVEPGELSVLSPHAVAPIPVKDPALPSSGRRLAYARQLTSGKHPLVARVLVNRFWLEHFGRGIVATPGDFGALGERPTHPELLDWLATDFVENGWKVKHFHKLVMTSATYRQSGLNPKAKKADPDNKLFGRMKPRRMEAETLRDTILAANGHLNPQSFGEPVPVARHPSGCIVVGREKLNGNSEPVGVDSVGDQEFRRSVYIQSLRRRPLTVLDTFDSPVMSPNCEIRPVTTVAPQSLLLMNDEFIVKESQTLAQRVRRERPGNAREQVERAWRLLNGAEPAPRDVTKAVDYLVAQTELLRQRLPASEAERAKAPEPYEQALASLCQVFMASNRFLYID